MEYLEIQSKDRSLPSTGYVTTVLPQRKVDTKKKTFKRLPKQQQICGHCTTGETETELQFLPDC